MMAADKKQNHEVRFTPLYVTQDPGGVGDRQNMRIGGSWNPWISYRKAGAETQQFFRFVAWVIMVFGIGVAILIIAKMPCLDDGLGFIATPKPSPSPTAYPTVPSPTTMAPTAATLPTVAPTLSPTSVECEENFGAGGYIGSFIVWLVFGGVTFWFCVKRKY